MLEIFAHQQSAPGAEDVLIWQLPVSRLISATKRSDRVGVVTVPSASSAARSAPSKTITVWPKRVSAKTGFRAKRGLRFLGR